MSDVIKINTGSFGTTITKQRGLVPHNDPILKIPTPTWNFLSTVNPIQIANELVDCMKEHNGLGLSAPQVGLSHRIFVMGSYDNIVVFINPRIIDLSQEKELLEEGCLSFPGLRLMIQRPKRIQVDYQDFNGKIHESQFDGLTARIFMHEFDHLNGIVFTQKCSKLKLDMAVKKAAKNNFFYKIKEL